MKSQTITEYAAPLQELDSATPVPVDAQVLLKVSHCGVCHSDVHLHDGHFDLGNDKRLDVRGGRELPFTLGHEIQGEVVAMGADVTGAKIGQQVVAFPWIGCGACATCLRGDEHLCDRSKNILGITTNGGFADYVLVPDSKYLLDFNGISAPFAATCMCSGLTAFSALNKVGPMATDDKILIIGLGGVGMMGLQFAKALFEQDILVADISDDKLALAKEFGAAACYNTSEAQALKQLRKDTGGDVCAVVDFVGSEATFAFANSAIRKGGTIIVTGLFGGAMSMPLPMFPLRALTITGSYVGSLAEAKQMLALVKGGKVAPIPIEQRPMVAANETLDDLRQGNIIGRVVLSPDGAP